MSGASTWGIMVVEAEMESEASEEPSLLAKNKGDTYCKLRSIASKPKDPSEPSLCPTPPTLFGDNPSIASRTGAAALAFANVEGVGRGVFSDLKVA